MEAALLHDRPHGRRRAEEAGGEEEKAGEEKARCWRRWRRSVESGAERFGGARRRAIGHSLVTAQATAAYKAVKVVKGETVELPFGPPYKPTVTANYFEDGNKQKLLSLGMSLVGSAGEVCTNMMVNGGRPPKPEFTITDAKGKVVQQGSFEYG